MRWFYSNQSWLARKCQINPSKLWNELDALIQVTNDGYMAYTSGTLNQSDGNQRKLIKLMSKGMQTGYLHLHMQYIYTHIRARIHTKTPEIKPGRINT
jgi:hypothetical protein